MIRDPNAPACPEPDEPRVPRVFLQEPGWRIARKSNSEREFCHNIAPGDETYHRLSDGELHVVSHDEKLCLPCADRRGLLRFEPKGLRGKPAPIVEIDGPSQPGDTFKVVERREDRPE